VQTLQASTGDLERMADRLAATGPNTVAMETTGGYRVAAHQTAALGDVRCANALSITRDEVRQARRFNA
jgi:hypothetical protein